jgi:hypothetical protein
MSQSTLPLETWLQYDDLPPNHDQLGPNKRLCTGIPPGVSVFGPNAPSYNHNIDYFGMMHPQIPNQLPHVDPVTIWDPNYDAEILNDSPDSNTILEDNESMDSPPNPESVKDQPQKVESVNHHTQKVQLVKDHPPTIETVPIPINAETRKLTCIGLVQDQVLVRKVPNFGKSPLIKQI